MKKIISVILSISLIFSFVAVAATAYAEEQTAQSAEKAPVLDAASVSISDPSELFELIMTFTNLKQLEELKAMPVFNSLASLLGKYLLHNPEKAEKLITKFYELYKSTAECVCAVGTEIEAAVTDEAKFEALKKSLTTKGFIDTDCPFFAFDIRSDVDPAETTEITVNLQWLSKIFELLPELENSLKDITVRIYHLLDSDDAINKAQADNQDISRFVPSDSSLFNSELEASGDSYVYYTLQHAELKDKCNVTFCADSFSTFFFVVDFSYLGYEFSAHGGSEIFLSELMKALNVGYDISNVRSVECSDESLVEINQQDGDWMLRFVKTFDAEEFLTITFNDDTYIKIKVTDPGLLYYYLDNTRWCMATTTNDDGRVVNSSSINSSSERITVYVRPGMAVAFNRNVALKGSANQRHKEGWEWISDGKDKYVLIDGSETFPESKGAVVLEVGNNVDIVVAPKITSPEPQLVEDQLKADIDLSRKFSLVDLPATLYNYDAEKFNSNYSGKHLVFRGTTEGKTTKPDNANWNNESSGAPRQANKGAGSVLMGIMKDKLKNDLPEPSQGDKVDFFSTTEFSGKEVYKDVAFQFIYEEETGYYTYSSNLNHAQFFNDEDKIKLYTKTLGPTNAVDGYRTQKLAGFYPFENIREAFLNVPYPYYNSNIGDTTDWNHKDAPNWYDDDYLNKATEQYRAKYVIDPVPTDLTSTDPKSTVNLHFGLQLNMDFYLSDEKKGPDGNDLIFDFFGDDDMWVYIDDTLVLDLGGMHAPETGKFNITQGTIHIDNYTKLSSANGGSYSSQVQGTNLNENSQFLRNLEGDKIHTLRVFYLERQAGVSNCRIHFNLPLMINNEVTVEKKVTAEDGEELSVVPDEEYTFQVYKAGKEDSHYDNSVNADEKAFEVLKNAKYTIEGVDGEHVTDENGKFKLKAGCIATFTGIERFSELYIKEITPDETDGDYTPAGTSVTLNNSVIEYKNGQTETTFMPAYPLNYVFTNKLKTEELEIAKEVVGGAKGLINSEQKFEFQLKLGNNEHKIIKDNTGIRGVRFTMGILDIPFTLGEGKSFSIPRIPTGMPYSLTEVNPDLANNSFDSPAYKLEIASQTAPVKAETKPFDEFFEHSIELDGKNKITVTNQQFFTLIITKTTLIDGEFKNPEQSFLFNVKGANEHNANIDLDLIIPTDTFNNGTGSVRVVRLPVGNYTVTENPDWGWRYELTNPDNISQTIIPKNAEENVDFENKREKTLWLSGECWCENRWKENGKYEVSKSRNGGN